MGRLANEARQHAKKIHHYHSHAGEAGYSQAKHHYDKLADLKWRASTSKASKGDLVEIQMIHDTIAPLMMEMKEREVTLGETDDPES